jgi:hypothetical protein
MEKRRCAVCRKTFTPTRRVAKQRFCADPECQKERRRRKQKKKRRRDEDYRENDQRAQREWAKKHPQYWKAYRESHPEYTEKNLQQQHQRDAKGGEKGAVVGRGQQGLRVTEDAPQSKEPFKSGIYELRLANSGVLANEDSMKVEISLLLAT